MTSGSGGGASGVAGSISYPSATPPMSILYDTVHYYTVGVFEKYGDPRVSNYHLMRTPWPTIFATVLYYWFVRSIGPKMMKDRKPYEILPLIRTYNLMMAAWNGFGFYIGCQLVNYGSEIIGCRPVDPFQRDDKTLAQIYYGWMFYTSRLVEFADTIFFVLRKKYSQTTSFHVFHHSSVPTVTWFFLKFAPGGNSGIFPFINTLIHTIMYSYYFLATFPSMRPYLGWKKYLTQMQIVQFFIIIACCLQPLFIPGCKFPRALLYIMVAFSFVFIYLFVDFYLKCYKQNKSQQQLKEERAKKEQQQQSPPTTELKSNHLLHRKVASSNSINENSDNINNNNNNNSSNRNNNHKVEATTDSRATSGMRKTKVL